MEYLVIKKWYPDTCYNVEYSMIPVIGDISRAIKFKGAESRMVLFFDCQWLGLGGNKELLFWKEFQFWKMEMFWRLAAQ